MGENSSSKGITTSSSTPRPSITSRLISNGMISFGAASGCRRCSGCGSKVRTVSAPSITCPVAEVDAVEGADRDVRGRGSASGSGVTLMLIAEHADALRAATAWTGVGGLRASAAG